MAEVYRGYHAALDRYVAIKLLHPFLADDPEFKTGVTTVYNNDYDDSAKMGKGSDRPYVETRFGLLVDGKGTKGRYVRLYSNGNTSNEMNHYIEVEVFGAQ